MIYFDNASSTKPSKSVVDGFLKAATEDYFNPNSIHKCGMKLFNEINRIRKDILKELKLDSNIYDVVFTSGASESNNLAIIGYALKNQNKGKKLITSKIEHESVLNVFKYLETEGFSVTYLDVNNEGKINIDEFKKVIDKDTILVSLMGVNNEIGSVFNIEEIKNVISNYPKCVLHVDAAQTLGKENFDYKNADLITLSAHKIYGLKGTGALIKKKKINLECLIHGGGQENDLRSGTLDYPGIYAFSIAIKEAMNELNLNYHKVKEISLYLKNELKNIEEVNLNSLDEFNPYIINFSLINKKASVMVEALSNEDILVSSVSACNSKKEEPSYVLLALNKSEKEARNAIRLSLGKYNTLEEAKKFIEVFKRLLLEIRS